MNTALLIDFGSTFTKVTAVDLEAKTVRTSQAPTTVATDITEGLQSALSGLGEGSSWRGLIENAVYRSACSSAAGGLRMVAIGLVRDLTVEAARQAALGAGARILDVYAHELTAGDIARIYSQRPDIILLAGGTDGGNREVILHNARMLATYPGKVPVVVAGNRVVAGDVAAILARKHSDVNITENVMPELNQINVEPAREAIRRVFMARIVEGKGLARAQDLVGTIVMPTPAAVLKAARLLSVGWENEAGLGDLMVIDVGGATTDVHSIGKGEPTMAGVMLKGLPEPFAKRTVEGDLGVRVSAASLWEAAGERRIRKNLDLMGTVGIGISPADRISKLAERTDFLPETEEDLAIDAVMAATAVELATERHAGTVEVVYTPFGATYVQHGKDLTGCRTLVGTGGVLVRQTEAARILAKALFDTGNPTVLKPKNPEFYLDRDYILAGMGLLAEHDPLTALQITKKYLKPLREGEI